MSKLQDIQQILVKYKENLENVEKEELIQVLIELCTYCKTLESECIKLLQNRNTITATTETPFSWESLRSEESPFKCHTYS